MPTGSIPVGGAGVIAGDVDGLAGEETSHV